jgi:hypothetical protein
VVDKYYSPEEFKKLVNENEPEDIVQRYILDLFPFCFKDNLTMYWELRETVCSRFALHPQSFSIAGSGKLGFSIAPDKFGKPFGDASDIDIILVSEKLFDDIWDDLVDFYQNPGFRLKPKNVRDEFNKLRTKLFYGNIMLHVLAKNFDFAKDLWVFFNQLSIDEKFGPREINAAIFKSWNHVSAYYTRSIVDLKIAKKEN